MLEVRWHHQRHGAPSLLSETCTLSTFLNGVAASSTVIKSFFLRGQNCSRDRLLVLLRADPGIGVGNPGKSAVRLVLLGQVFLLKLIFISCHILEIINTTNVATLERK